MKKNIFFSMLVILVVCAACSIATAQTAQIHIRNAQDQVATKIQTLHDGSGDFIIGGYEYTVPAGASAIGNSKMVLMRISADGTTIIWQKKFGIDKTGNVMYDMIITHDDNIVIAGSVGRSTLYNNNIAALMKFNSTNGDLIWNRSMYDVAETNGGEVFNGVAQLRDGRLIAVGTHDATINGVASGFIAVYTDNGVFRYNVVNNVNGSGDGGSGYQSVTTDGDRAFICGNINGNYSDGQVLEFDPGSFTATSGAIVWNNFYDFTLVGVNKQLALNDNFFSEIHLDEAAHMLVIGGGSLADYTYTGGEGESITWIKTDGTSPRNVQVQNDNSTYANTTRLYVKSMDRIYNLQMPANDWIDPINWITGTAANSVVTEITSLTAETAHPPVLYRYAEPGTHSLFDITMMNGNLYMAGNAVKKAGGHSEIYCVVTPSTLPKESRKESKDCWSEKNNVEFVGAPLIAETPYVTASPFIREHVHVPVENLHDVIEICGSIRTQGPCVDTCTRLTIIPDTGSVGVSTVVGVNTVVAVATVTATDGNSSASSSATGTSTVTAGPNQPCHFIATINACTDNTVLGYVWNITYSPAGSGPSVTFTDLSSSTTDSHNIIVPYGSTAIISVTIHVANEHMQCCDTTIVDSITCNGAPNCAAFDTAKTTLNYNENAGPNGCAFALTAISSTYPGWNVFEYQWVNATSGTILATDYTTSNTDNYLVSLFEYTSEVINVTYYATNGIDTCSFTRSITLTCDTAEAGGPANRKSNLGNNSADNGFTVFPNPTQGSVTLSSQTNAITTVEVMDAAGKHIATYNYNSTQVDVSLNELPSGNYLLLINGTISRTVTKSN